jgi:O-antigen ligase
VLVLITVAYLARLIMKRSHLRLSTLGIMLTAWVCINGLSIMWSVRPDLALIRSLALFRGLVIFFILGDWLAVDFKHRIIMLARCMAISAVAVIVGFAVGVLRAGGLAGLTNMISAQEPLVSGNRLLAVIRAETSGGIFLDGPDLWLLLCLSVIIGTAKLEKIKTMPRRIIFMVLVGIILSAIVLMFRRSILLALGTLLIILFIQWWTLSRRNNSELKMVFVMVAIVMLVGYVFGFSNVLISRFSQDALASEQSIRVRYDLYQIAWNSFTDSPILGVGTGNVLGVRDIVHNLPLQVAAETGIIGLSFFVSLYIIAFSFIIRLERLFKSRNQGGHLLIAMAIFAVIAAYIVQSMAASDFETPDPWMQFAIVSAMWVRYGPSRVKDARYA